MIEQKNSHCNTVFVCDIKCIIFNLFALINMGHVNNLSQMVRGISTSSIAIRNNVSRAGQIRVINGAQPPQTVNHRETLASRAFARRRVAPTAPARFRRILAEYYSPSRTNGNFLVGERTTFTPIAGKFKPPVSSNLPQQVTSFNGKMRVNTNSSSPVSTANYIKPQLVTPTTALIKPTFRQPPPPPSGVNLALNANLNALSRALDEKNGVTSSDGIAKDAAKPEVRRIVKPNESQALDKLINELKLAFAKSQANKLTGNNNGTQKVNTPKLQRLTDHSAALDAEAEKRAARVDKAMQNMPKKKPASTQAVNFGVHAYQPLMTAKRVNSVNLNEALKKKFQQPLRKVENKPRDFIKEEVD